MTENSSVNVADTLNGLVNKLTGQGTARDKITGASWHFTAPQSYELRNLYRSYWVARKAIDIPISDMFSQGWDWEADQKDRELIIAEEKRLQVKAKLKKARTLADLYGGSAIILGDGSSNPAQPLNPALLGKGGLQFMTVLTRFELTSGRIEHDVLSPQHNLPENYQVSGSTSANWIHPSRVVRFEGKDQCSTGSQIEDLWGDSTLTGIMREMAAVATGTASSARLLEETTVNYYRMKGLMDMLTKNEGTDAVFKALNLMQTMKSSINAVAIDAEDGNMDQFQANFAGLPEIIRLLLQTVAGGADIPMTRFLGQSADGMNATGEGDDKNYNKRIRADQEEKLQPALDQINAALIPSALGSTSASFSMSFNPLYQLTEVEQAELDAKNAATLTQLGQGGHVPDTVMKAMTRNILTASPTFPGASQAYDEATEEELDDTGGGEPSDDEVSKAVQVGDSRPMTLYVSRKVKNGAAIVKWAKDQGFETTLDAEDMHITLAYSRTPIDWHKAGHAWEDEIKISAGGPRSVERFGEKYVVLQVSWDSLKWRHEQIKRAGATWDHPDYSPHVSISTDAGDIDLETITPYQGEIVLGPEIFEKVKEG